MEADSTYSADHVKWVVLLEAAAASDKGKDGSQREYLFIRKGEVAFYATTEDAKAAGYKPLSFKKISTMTQKKLQDCTDAETLSKASRAIRKIGRIESYNREITPTRSGVIVSSFRKIFPKNKIEDMEKCASALHFESLTKTLANATRIVKSAKGTPGVIFIETDTPRRLVLKFTDEPLVEMGAEHFFDLMGFMTPHAFSVSKESEEGQGLLEFVKGRIEDLSEKDRERVTFLMLPRNYCLVMDCLDATSFDQLMPRQLVQAMQDEHLLQKIGEMVLYDHFIGNDDRLNAGGCNTGNFMLVVGEKEAGLALIDSAIDASEFRTRDLENLLQENGAEPIVDMLIFVISKQHGENPELDKTFIQDNVVIGIRRGAETLLAMFPDKEAVKVFTDSAGLPASVKVNVAVLIERLQKIEVLTKNNEHKKEGK